MLTLALLMPLLQACQTYQIHPFEIGITLPYSGACRFKNVVTGVTYEVEPNQCDRLKRRSLILTSDAWRVIRTDIQANCAQQQCVELQGKLDQLFLTVDQSLQKIPW